MRARFLTVVMAGYRQTRKNARMIYAVMDLSWGHQYEFVFILVQIQMTRNIYI